MQMKVVLGVLVAVVLVVGGVWYYQQGGANSYHVEIDSQDRITNWQFQSSHKDGGELEKRVRDEITKLEAGLEDEATEPSDYALHVGIAGQYSLLGDGEKMFEHLEEALAIDSTTTGLAWHNLAVLMERLGALNTARTAYARAVEAQSVDAYHVARLNFLIKNFAQDQAGFEAAVAEAEEVFGKEMPFIMQVRAEWYEKLGLTNDAITAWRALQNVLPDEEMKASIDDHIERLRRQTTEESPQS